MNASRSVGRCAAWLHSHLRSGSRRPQSPSVTASRARGVPGTAVRRRLSGLQGPPAALAVAVGQERSPCCAGSIAFSGHGAATEEARGPIDFASQRGYRYRIAVRGRQSRQPRCRPPGARQLSERRRPERLDYRTKTRSVRVERRETSCRRNPSRQLAWISRRPIREHR